MGFRGIPRPSIWGGFTECEFERWCLDWIVGFSDLTAGPTYMEFVHQYMDQFFLQVDSPFS
jgi:hypothetical protein